MHPLRRKRNKKPMSMDELHEASGVAKGTILSIENGRVAQPQARILRALAKALGCEPGELVE